MATSVPRLELEPGLGPALSGELGVTRAGPGSLGLGQQTPWE